MKIKIGEIKTDLLIFAQAIEAAFPKECSRDRFGRYTGPRDTDRLRQLAVKYRDFGIDSGGIDTQDQAGMVARAMLKALREA